MILSLFLYQARLDSEFDSIFDALQRLRKVKIPNEIEIELDLVALRMSE